MYKDAEVLMRHILDECDFIVSITQSLSKEEFVRDGELRRVIEIIKIINWNEPIYFDWIILV